MTEKYQQAKSLSELLFTAVFSTASNYKSCTDLYHYTDSRNYKYIVGEKNIDLRLTRADKFDSDKQEGQHILGLFKNTCNKMVCNGIISRSFGQSLISMCNDFNKKYDEYRHRYVFCFSKKSNNKKLICEYAHKSNPSGIIIGIHSLDIEDIVYENDSAIEIFDINYDTYFLEHEIMSLIVELYKRRHEDDQSYSLIQKTVINYLCCYCLIYKDSKFKDEEETRIVINYARIEKTNTQFFLDSVDDKYLHCLIPKKALYHIENV